MKRTLLLPLFLLLAVPGRADEPGSVPAPEMFSRMLDRIEETHTLELYVRAMYRMQNEQVVKKGLLRMQRSPLAVYFRQDAPDEGMEILFREDLYEGKALVWPNRFPWINLRLDPQGSLMRKNSNHSLYEAGFWYLGDMIREILSGAMGEAVTRNEGWTLSQGERLIKLSLNLPGFGFRSYRVGEGEDLIRIAQKLKVADYMILDRNPEIGDLWDVSPGQVIRVPTCYASRMVLLVDPESFLPRSIEIYDDRGLFEQYDYVLRRINQPFPGEVFSPEYPEYGF